MLAPLPRLYRLLVVVVALAVGAVAAGWLGRSWDLTLSLLLVGPAAGLLVAFVLVHDFHPAARPARVHRHRRP